MKLGARIVTMCAAIAIPSTAPGQTLLWEHVSPNAAVTPDILYGSSIFMPGDLNFDGVNDILVSCSSSPNGAQTNAGYVGVLSGVDGTPIYELHGIGGGPFWEPALRCDGLSGDIDGDGATDYWITYSLGAFVGLMTQLLSGATGTLIASPPPTAGPDYKRVGDISGDGIGDIVLVSYGLTAYAGPAFTQILWSLPPPTAVPVCNIYPRRFRSVVPMGDVNGDGIVDLLAGVSGQCAKYCWTAPGSACVVSGSDGAILRQWNGSGGCDYFGWRVVSPGDLDGDGISDAVVDVPGLGVGGVLVFSTGSGNQLASYPGPATQQWAHGLVALGDVDGDGFREFAMQSLDAAHVEVRSVATSTVLATLSAPPAFPYPVLGESLGSPGDVNGDGVPDLVTGLRGFYSPGPNGRVRMYSLAPVGVSAFGSGCPQADGSLARIGASRSAQAGQPFTLNLSVVPPNVGALALFGLSNAMNGTTPLPWNLAGYGMPSCSLLVSLDLVIQTTTVQIRPGEGAASFTATIPAGLNGVTFCAQWAVGNPAGSAAPAAMTRGLAITIQ